MLLKRNRDVIFTLQYHLSEDTHITIRAIHTGKYEARGTSIITIEARVRCPVFNAGKPFTLWPEGQTWCSPGPSHADDSETTKELVTSLVAIKPGDTDKDYFANYNADQLAFAERFGEELTMLAQERYGES